MLRSFWQAYYVSKFHFCNKVLLSTTTRYPPGIITLPRIPMVWWPQKRHFRSPNPHGLLVSASISNSISFSLLPGRPILSFPPWYGGLKNTKIPLRITMVWWPQKRHFGPLIPRVCSFRPAYHRSKFHFCNKLLGTTTTPRDYNFCPATKRDSSQCAPTLSQRHR